MPDSGWSTQSLRHYSQNLCARNQCSPVDPIAVCLLCWSHPCRNFHLFTLRIFALLGSSSSSRRRRHLLFWASAGRVELIGRHSRGQKPSCNRQNPPVQSLLCLLPLASWPLEIFLLLDASKTDEVDRQIKDGGAIDGRPDKARLGAKCRRDTQRSRPSQKHRPQTPKGTRGRLCKKMENRIPKRGPIVSCDLL